MLLKISQLVTLSTTLLFSASPMVSTSMSTDNGGTKKAIDAYSDGAGVLVINQTSATKFDNSSMNKLVFKYGDAAKLSNTTIKNQVNVLSPNATVFEKAAASTTLEVAKVVINPPVNGTQCDDGLSTTTGDVWLGGVCAGPLVDGTSCTDNNTKSINDKLTTGVCSGVIPKSCFEIKRELPSSVDGVYNIYPDGINPYGVYCDMTTDGGGWTLITKIVANSRGHINIYNVNDGKLVNTTDMSLPAKLADSLINNILNSGEHIVKAKCGAYGYSYFKMNQAYNVMIDDATQASTNELTNAFATYSLAKANTVNTAAVGWCTPARYGSGWTHMTASTASVNGLHTHNGSGACTAQEIPVSVYGGAVNYFNYSYNVIWGSQEYGCNYNNSGIMWAK